MGLAKYDVAGDKWKLNARGEINVFLEPIRKRRSFQTGKSRKVLLKIIV